MDSTFESPGKTRTASVIAGDARLQYTVAGKGSPVVLLHGFVASSFAWRRLVPALASDYRVYAVDAWASGGSERCEGADATLRGHATRLLAFLRELRIERCRVIASSYGGAVALQAAIIEPVRFERLVLAAPAHPFAKQPRVIARFYCTAVGKRVAHLFPRVPQSWFRVAMRRAFGNRAACTAELARAYYGPLRAPGTIDCLLRSLTTYSSDMEALAAELKCVGELPVRLIWGERDAVVPLASAVELKLRLKDATLNVIPGIGHLPYEEAAKEFAVAVWNALGQEGGGAEFREAKDAAVAFTNLPFPRQEIP